jgi:hyperosmotically inducible protein
MLTKLATALFVAGTIAAPAATYAAGTTSTQTTTTQTTPSARSTMDKTKEAVGDAAITTKVKAKFAKDRDVSAMNIKVDTDNGVVKLSGNAKSQAEADKAAEIAKNTEGVASVSNDIRVSAAGTKY